MRNILQNQFPKNNLEKVSTISNPISTSKQQIKLLFFVLFSFLFTSILFANNNTDAINDCNYPVVNSVFAVNENICAGETSTIRIDGLLNDATEWNVYTEDCGGTFVGTAIFAGNSRGFIYELEVTPTETTTYYFRGEGGCVTMADCIAVTVNVNTEIPASLPVLSLSEDNICVGNSTTIFILGDLNDATEWNVYTGDCGGDYVGTGVLSGNSRVTTLLYALIVTPTETTTYYIRGEGGDCVNPGECASITVHVNNPVEPDVACWETATFNQDTCSWLVTGIQPDEPIASCGEIVAFNDIDCVWVISPDPLNVSIAASELPVFCQGAALTLTANLENAVSYLWSSGETTPTLEISENGTYTVTATNTDNCSESSSYTVSNLEIENLLSSYTILATKEIKLYDHNTVVNGALGVTGSDGKIEVKKYSNVADFAKAHEVKVEDFSTVGQEIEIPATVTIPNFIYNTVTNGDSQEIIVEANQTLTLDGNVYGKIEVKENATLTFSAENIYAKEIKTKEGATINFEQCANVYLVKGIDFYKNTTFNALGNNVLVFADYSVNVKEGSNVIAKIHANDHDIKVEGKDENPTTMKGLFIAEKVEGYKYVTWEQDFVCDPCEIIEQPVTENCECNGGLVEVVVSYAGGGVLTSNSGTVTDNGDGTYTITATNGEKLEKDLEIYSVNNTAQIHTSCSQSILGNTFDGGIEVIGYTDTEGNVTSVDGCYNNQPEECECNGGLVEIIVSYAGGGVVTSNSGIVTDNGDGTYTISATNGEKLEKDLEIYTNNNTAAIHTSCSQSILGFTFDGGVEVIGYTDTEGNVTSVDGCSTITLPEECECNGGLFEVVISYVGGGVVTSNSGTVTDNGDGTYTIASNNGVKLEKDLEIYTVNNTAEIHTSCSQSILGFTFDGGVEVIGYTDTEGNMTTLDGCVSVPSQDCECKDGLVSITIIYPGGPGATLIANSGTITDNGDGTYTIVAPNGEKLEKDFEIYDGTSKAEIHTSCSQELIGVTFGGGIQVLGYIDYGGNTFNEFGCNVLPENKSKLENDLTIKLFPNPAKNLFNISINSVSTKLNTVTIQVYDISGHLILNETTKNKEYSFGSNLSSGFYFVKIETSNNYSKVIKVIKE